MTCARKPGWWAYWLVSARRVKKTRKSEPRRSRIIHVTLVCFAFFLITLPVFRIGLLGWRLLPEARAAFWIGVALLFAGLGFALWARVHIGEYWSGTVALKQEHRLIRTGPYALVRHPIYVGTFLGFFGTTVANGEVRGAVALAILVLLHLLKSRREERWLLQEFGEQYVRYCKEVNALMPFPRWTNRPLSML